MQPFDVTLAERDYGVCVAVRGELDLETKDLLQDALEPVLTRRDAVVVDLSQVAFVDSTAIALLLRLRARLRADDRPFAIVGQTPPAGRIFALTGIEEELNLVPTLEAAEQHLRVAG